MRVVRWLHSFLAVVLLLVGGSASTLAYAVSSPLQKTPCAAALNKIEPQAYPIEELRLTLETRNGLFVSNNPVNYVDPTGEIAFAIPLVYYGVTAAGAAAVGTSAWLNTPEGRQAMQNLGQGISDGLGNLWDTLFNENQGEEQAVDGGGKACPVKDLEPTGETKEEGSTRKGNKGGKSVQEGYVDSQGRPVTKHTVYGPKGNVIHGPHYRPGGFK